MSTALPLPDLDARSRPSDFFTGLAAPFRAIAVVRGHPELRRLARWMAAVTAVALVALLWLLGKYADDLLSLIWTRPESWYGALAWSLLAILLFLLSFAVLATFLPPLLLAPLQDPLSESVETLATGRTPPPFTLQSFLGSLVTGLAHTLGRLVLVLIGLAVLLPLNLVPVVGSLAYTVLATCWSAVGLAAEHLGAPMARHLFPWAAVRRLVLQRPALLLGFGLGSHALLFVPVLNFFFVPYVVVAGTMLFLKLREADALGTTERE